MGIITFLPLCVIIPYTEKNLHGIVGNFFFFSPTSLALFLLFSRICNAYCFPINITQTPIDFQEAQCGAVNTIFGITSNLRFWPLACFWLF